MCDNYTIQKIEVNPDDVILLQVSNLIDFDSAESLYKEVQDIFPNNKVLVANTTLLKGINILHIKEDNHYINEITFENEKSLNYILQDIIDGDIKL